MKKKKVTIQDIADALGISRNTVSKAINNTDGLAEGTREKILQKAIEMGYKQFSYVNGLVKTSTDTNESPGYQGEIAIITGTFLNHSHFAALMLDKFQREVSDLGYTVSLHRVTEQNFVSKSLPITLQLDQVKAIMCIEMFDWEYDEMLCDLEIPILFVDSPVKKRGKTLPADQLYMENASEITRFMCEKIDKGYKRFGFIGTIDHCQSFYERYMAYYTTLLTNGLKADERFLVSGISEAEITEKILALDEVPEIFICANDFCARDALAGLTARGLSVPGDVMLLGFDDSAESRIVTPQLSTVHIHTQITAFSAVHLLISRIKQPELDYRILYTQTDLVLRDSTIND